MPSVTVNATRMELTRLKNRLKTAVRGHKLLKDKRDELMKQFLESVRENRTLRRRVEEGLMRAHGSFTVASALMSPEGLEQALLYPKQRVELDMTTRNIMSVPVPMYTFRTKECKGKELYPYGFAMTSCEIDGAVEALSSVFQDMLKLAQEKGEPPFLFLLDGIEDPHNLGAIIRTANLAGAHGVIIPKRRAVGLTATVAKTSAGALNYTPVAKVTNLTAVMEELKKQGLWFVCADMGGEVMYRMNLTGPIGLVIGNEGEGVGKLVREHCDMTASIPMKGDIDSLNASVAAGVLAYEIVRQRMAK